MFCYQCEETARGTGCTVAGVCGKSGEVATLQDKLIYTLRGISYLSAQRRALGVEDQHVNQFVMEGLFSTITNVNFSKGYFIDKIEQAMVLRDTTRQSLMSEYQAKHGAPFAGFLPDVATWHFGQTEEQAAQRGILSTQDEDVRSLEWLLTYGIKGMAAYAHHAYVLGYTDDAIYSFMQEGLAAPLTQDISTDKLLALVMKCGEVGVLTMALLDKANTETYGNPQPTKVSLGVRNNPAILISGHDLNDLAELLQQTQGTGVDVYTHGEMLPAHAYPYFSKFPHLVGNYGGSWFHQTTEFDSFNGPILMTTNCLVPPKDSYKERVYTTGVVGFVGVKHIPDREPGKQKDFCALIEHAKKTQPPKELETGTVWTGFGHHALLSVADKVVDAVKQGKIRHFVAMGGCDGRHNERSYYTEFAQALPSDTIILTAGCAKYRYNKLPLGEINGIPRVLDAGQCNDNYSLVVVANKLVEAFGKQNVNQLPLSFNIAWYEQKAVLVLLSLLSLGIKDISLGPKLPAFASPNVLKLLVDKFGIRPNSTVEEDMKRMLG